LSQRKGWLVIKEIGAPACNQMVKMVTVDESNQGVWAGELENGWLYRTVAAQ